MSIFQGKLHEYPQIAIDNFTKETHKCTAFFLSHCHRDHMEGLESKEFLELLKRTNSKIFLFCSETTKNLMEHDKQLSQLCRFTKSIPVSQPTMISIFDENMQSSFELSVTLISAGHCVGSVMFFFEGNESSVLYTGDFRLSKGDIQRVKCLKTQNGVKSIKELYIDTTFCTPCIPQLPSREESTKEVIRLIKNWVKDNENRLVFIQCSANYGYEFILKEVAKELETRIHVDDRKFALYSCIPGMTEFLTSDGQSTKIHSCCWKMTDCADSSLPCIFPFCKPTDVLQIKPSTLWIYKYRKNSKSASSYDYRNGLHRVLHSMHASYEEISDLIQYLQPHYVFPTVVPVDANDILYAYNRLRGLLSRKSETAPLPNKKAKMLPNDLCCEEDSISRDLFQFTRRKEIGEGKDVREDPYDKETVKGDVEVYECSNKGILNMTNTKVANRKYFIETEYVANDENDDGDDNGDDDDDDRDDCEDNHYDNDEFNVPNSPGIADPSDSFLASFYKGIHHNL